MADEAARFPGYDVLARRGTPSWNEPTRRAIAQRLQTPRVPRFLTPAEWATADALCRRIIPQEDDEDANLPAEPKGRSESAVPLVALLDAKLFHDQGSGFRHAGMPYMREAWRLGLAALDAEARERHGSPGFAGLDGARQDALVAAMQSGECRSERWEQMSAESFFRQRVLVDVPALYYGHPKAWNEIGFGGPASPRGYVRLDGKRLDPWEAVQADPERPGAAERANRHVV